MTLSSNKSNAEGSTQDAGMSVRAAPRISGFAVRLTVIITLTGLLMSAFGVNIGAVGQGLALATVGVGVFISFRVLNFPDLSVDGSFPIGGAVAAALIVNFGIGAEWTLPLAFAAGALVGLTTGLIHVMFRIEGLLVSIIVMTGAYTLVLRIMGRSNIPLLDSRTILTPYQEGVRDAVVNILGTEARRQANNLTEIVVFSVVVVVMLLLLNWLLHTQIGLATRAAGRNSQMVRAISVNDELMVIIGLMLSNGFAGLAGALTVQQQGFADAQMGVGSIVRGLAAVMIGEVLLNPRSVGQAILAAAVGMVVFEVMRAWAFVSFRLDATDFRLVSALVVLAALAAPSTSQRGREWWHRRKERERSERNYPSAS